jgi:hypothetical protein
VMSSMALQAWRLICFLDLGRLFLEAPSAHIFPLDAAAAAAAVKHQRARSPGPQARGPLSQWTEAWPRPLIGGERGKE